MAQTTHTSPHIATHYSAQTLATEYNVSLSTIRSRWFTWLVKVAPAELLKDDQGYSELAHSLFAEFSAVAKQERSAWVADAKAKYSQEWSAVGIIDGELMPEEVGSVLAAMQQRGDHADQEIALQLAAVENFLGDLYRAEVDMSEGEIKTYRANGVQRGLQRFQLETQTELEVLNMLRNKRIKGDKK